MTERWAQFSSVPPAWGQSHLALDAMVAFVDDELSAVARRRALAHLAGCPECAAEVVAQTQTRLALRASPPPQLSSSLLRSLRAIPSHAEMPAPPAGLAVGPDGELVAEARPGPTRIGRRGRSFDRRVRRGVGAAACGIALGALVMTGAPSAASNPGTAGAPLEARLRMNQPVTTTAEAVDARMTLAPGATAARPAWVPRFGHYRWYR